MFPYDSETDMSSVEDFVDDEKESQDSESLHEEVSECQGISDDDSDDNQQSAEHDHTGFICNIQERLPDEFCNLLKQQNPMQLPYYMSTKVDAIVAGLNPFCGSALINESDIQGRIGNHVIPEQNCLSNFVIDGYLDLKKLSCNDKEVTVQTMKWELFEKGDIATIVQKKCFSCIIESRPPIHPLQCNRIPLLVL